VTSSQKRGLARLMLRLPEWRKPFGQVTSDAFLDICESYDLAYVGLQSWAKSERPISRQMVAEYSDIIAALEAEAQWYASPEIEKLGLKQAGSPLTACALIH
jgi:hypothetical protein